MSQLGPDSNPPVSSEFSLPVEPPAWPKVVGIISIVWAALGVPCSACSSIATLGGPALYEWGRQKQIAAKMPDTGPMPAVFQPGPPEMLSSVIWLAGVVVLLVAGILVVRRRAGGRPAHLLYAVISIVGTLVFVVSAVMKAHAISAWIAQNPSDPYLKQPGAQFAANAVFAVVTAVICLIYPVFIALWFGMMGKRPEIGAGPREPLV